MTRRDFERMAAGLIIGGCVATLIAQTGRTRAPLRYEFLRGGKLVAHQIVTSSGSVISGRFEGDDRGRAWGFDESTTLDAGGIPMAIALTGTGPDGQLVSDQYRTDGGTVTWRNAAESGSSQATRRFYLTMPIFDGHVAAMPNELGVLTRALLASPTRTLQLAPAGIATVRRVGAMSVSGHSETKQIVQYEVLGLDYAPFEIWLEPDGALFAAFTAGTIVREGWADVVPALLAAQRTALQTDAEALERQIARRPSGPFAFVHARLFDPRTMSSRDRMTVVVNGRTIGAVGADGTVRVRHPHLPWPCRTSWMASQTPAARRRRHQRFDGQDVLGRRRSAHVRHRTAGAAGGRGRRLLSAGRARRSPRSDGRVARAVAIKQVRADSSWFTVEAERIVTMTRTKRIRFTQQWLIGDVAIVPRHPCAAPPGSCARIDIDSARNG